MLLNKHGWGLREMLLVSSVLFIFLFIAIFYIYALYDNLDKNMLVTPYSEMESKLERQANIYLNDYYDNALSEHEITITRSVLKSHDLDVSLIDPNGNSCSGYVLASKNGVKAYIKCDEYTTDGYKRSRW